MNHPASPPQTVSALDPVHVVQRELRRLWRRRLLGKLVEAGWRVALLLAAALLAVGVYRFFDGRSAFDAGVAWRLLGAAVLGVTIYAFGAVATPESTAEWIDRRARTHDRFHTALAFAERASAGKELTPLEHLTLAECVRYVKAFPTRRWTPLRPPARAWWALAPLMSLALLWWHAASGVGQAPHDPKLDRAVAKRAAALQTMAEKLERDEPNRKDPMESRVTEAMKRAADQLKEAQNQGDDAKLKTALGELSSLQAMLAAMQQAQREEKVSPGELAALAAALQANQPSQAAGESIQQGQLEQAGDQLEKLAEQMKAQNSGDQAEAMQQLAQSMQEQAGKLSEAEKNAVARQMQQAAQAGQSGQSQLGAQAMQRLAELLRKAGQNGAGGAKRQASNQGGKAGQPMSEQQLQSLLNALENMKDGLQAGGDGGESSGGDSEGTDGPGDGTGGKQSLALVESFAKQGGGEAPAGDQASGVPGGDMDKGTNEHLYAEHPTAAAESGQAKRLAGMLGDGASLQELVGATAGPAKASRGYKELYQAVVPAEQNSVEQENIPLGSRVFVRKYFENIRPAN